MLSYYHIFKQYLDYLGLTSKCVQERKPTLVIHTWCLSKGILLGWYMLVKLAVHICKTRSGQFDKPNSKGSKGLTKPNCDFITPTIPNQQLVTWWFNHWNITQFGILLKSLEFNHSISILLKSPSNIEIIEIDVLFNGNNCETPSRPSAHRKAEIQQITNPGSEHGD